MTDADVFVLESVKGRRLFNEWLAERAERLTDDELSGWLDGACVFEDEARVRCSVVSEALNAWRVEQGRPVLATRNLSPLLLAMNARGVKRYVSMGVPMYSGVRLAAVDIDGRVQVKPRFTVEELHAAFRRLWLGTYVADAGSFVPQEHMESLLMDAGYMAYPEISDWVNAELDAMDAHADGERIVGIGYRR